MWPWLFTDIDIYILQGMITHRHTTTHIIIIQSFFIPSRTNDLEKKTQRGLSKCMMITEIGRKATPNLTGQEMLNSIFN